MKAGELFNLRQGSQLEMTNLPPSDDFDLWSGNRDRALSSIAVTHQYVPQEIVRLYPDLDPYGSWIYVSNYGYCWVPRVSADWRPFDHGRWIYWRDNYTWVSYDSWGWVPHHYGRWTFVASTGWCWVPPVGHQAYWTPGAVAWYSGPDYIYWVPLAPRETYYAHGRFGPYSVNVVNVNFNYPYGKIVHKNFMAPDSIIRVQKGKFFDGRYTPVSVSRIHQEGNKEFYYRPTPGVDKAAYKATPYRVTERSRMLPPESIAKATTWSGRDRTGTGVSPGRVVSSPMNDRHQNYGATGSRQGTSAYQQTGPKQSTSQVVRPNSMERPEARTFTQPNSGNATPRTMEGTKGRVTHESTPSVIQHQNTPQVERPGENQRIYRRSEPSSGNVGGRTNSPNVQPMTPERRGGQSLRSDQPRQGSANIEQPSSRQEGYRPMGNEVPRETRGSTSSTSQRPSSSQVNRPEYTPAFLEWIGPARDGDFAEAPESGSKNGRS